MRKTFNKAPASASHAKLSQLLTNATARGRINDLHPADRNFLYAAALATIIPADARVRDEELHLYADFVTQELGLGERELEALSEFIMHAMAKEELRSTAQVLRNNLSMAAREELVGRLWDIAFADHELHKSEEQMVMGFANVAGVSEQTAMQIKKATHAA